jgi:hypothetical protein
LRVAATEIIGDSQLVTEALVRTMTADDLDVETA